MFARNTVLERREPFEAPNPKADPPVEGDPRYIYNHVRVVGPSPIAYMGGEAAEWQGVGRQGVVIEPLDGYGGTVDKPLGEIQRDYVIVKEPEPTVVQPTVKVVNAHTREAGPSPEDVFAEVAVAADKPRRGRSRK